MTAPAEDPRGGEACDCRACSYGHPMECEYEAERSVRAALLAAGRGDTDSGGEACDCRLADGDGPGCAAEPSQELREAIARWEFARRAPARYWGSGALDGEEADARSAADELLAGPLAALLDAQAADRAKIERIEAVLADMYTHPSTAVRAWSEVLRGALDGAT